VLQLRGREQVGTITRGRKRNEGKRNDGECSFLRQFRNNIPSRFDLSKGSAQKQGWVRPSRNIHEGTYRLESQPPPYLLYWDGGSHIATLSRKI